MCDTYKNNNNNNNDNKQKQESKQTKHGFIFLSWKLEIIFQAHERFMPYVRTPLFPRLEVFCAGFLPLHSF